MLVFAESTRDVTSSLYLQSHFYLWHIPDQVVVISLGAIFGVALTESILSTSLASYMTFSLMRSEKHCIRKWCLSSCNVWKSNTDWFFYQRSKYEPILLPSVGFFISFFLTVLVIVNIVSGRLAVPY